MYDVRIPDFSFVILILSEWQKINMEITASLVFFLNTNRDQDRDKNFL